MKKYIKPQINIMKTVLDADLCKWSGTLHNDEVEGGLSKQVIDWDEEEEW